VNINTTAKDFEMSAAINQFTRDEVRSALQHFSENIHAIDVFMSDTNGPKGGIDKQALIRVHLRGGEVIALQTVHENMYAAIKMGTKRARRTVRRSMRKSRRVGKLRMRDLLNDTGIQTVT